MGLAEAVLYGLVQGLTEFLPISSSGHLFLVSELLGWKDAGAGFTAVIQLGTLLAVLVYFWKDLGQTLSGWLGAARDPSRRGSPESRLGWSVAIGTVPVVVAGLALESKIDKDFRSGYVVAGCLIVLGLVLYAAELVAKRRRTIKDVTWVDGLVIGLWQCLALVPGSSRSGSTITGGLFQGFDRESAAKYSFLLSVPAVVLSGGYKLVKDRDQLFGAGAMPTIVATVVAFGSGYWAISFLMKFLQKRPTHVFIVYRVVLGLVVLGLLLSGRVPAEPSAKEALSAHGVFQEEDHS